MALGRMPWHALRMTLALEFAWWWCCKVARHVRREVLRCASETLIRAQELRKSRMRRLWDMGRMIYRLTAFSYGAFSVYENPWLVRAVLAALWTASRVILRTALTGLIL